MKQSYSHSLEQLELYHLMNDSHLAIVELPARISWTEIEDLEPAISCLVNVQLHVLDVHTLMFSHSALGVRRYDIRY